jgi:CDP-glucose 4,6-dehydratase
MNNTSWKNKRVLITGATGFIGQHLMEYFLYQGALVKGTTRKKDSGSNFVHSDILHKESLQKIFSKSHFDICYHLAGESTVEHGQLSSYKTFKTNIVGTLNILELCRKFHVNRVIIASTMHVYGNAPLPYREEEPARPSRPYETSKTCNDLMAQSYADTFRLPVVIPRFANIYGPGDLHFSRIIPKTIRSVILGKPPKMWGGNIVREYLYIEDVIRAYASLAGLSDGQLERNRIYNFGSNERISVHDLIYKILLLMKSDMKVRKVAESRKDEVQEQYVETAKAARVLEWKSKINLETGLEQTIAWYRKYFTI